MFICSRHRLTFENSGLIALDYGEFCAPPVVSASGGARQASFLGRQSVRNFGLGNQRGSWTWSTVFKYDTPAEALSYEGILRNRFPVGQSESLLVEIENGTKERISDFVLEGCEARVMTDQPRKVLVTFQGVAGEETLIDRAGIGGPGWDEISQAWGFTGLPSAVTFQGAGGPVTEAFMWDSELGRYAGPGGVIFSEEGFWWLGAEIGVMTWQGPEVGCGVLGNYEFTPPGVTVALSAEVAPVGNFVYPSIFD